MNVVQFLKTFYALGEMFILLFKLLAVVFDLFVLYEFYKLFFFYLQRHCVKILIRITCILFCSIGLQAFIYLGLVFNRLFKSFFIVNFFL